MKSVDASSKNILVVEGNHEGLVTKCNDGKLVGAAERYAAVLQGLEKNMQIKARNIFRNMDNASFACFA